MSLNDSVKKFLEDPENDGIAKDNIRSLMASHLITGMELQRQGLLREAIQEFTRENNRPINSDIDAEIAQKSYWHIGVAYRKLGEMDNAKAAFQSARDLLKQHRIGVAPHYNLAEILIEQGQFDEAIEVCQESLELGPDKGIKQLLAKALGMKQNKLE